MKSKPNKYFTMLHYHPLVKVILLHLYSYVEVSRHFGVKIQDKYQNHRLPVKPLWRSLRYSSWFLVDLIDPTYVVASQHFRQLFHRYGSPGKCERLPNLSFSSVLISLQFLFSISSKYGRKFCIDLIHRTIDFQKIEKKKREYTLSEEFCGALDYIKQFIPDENGIQYLAFDMARANRSYVNYSRYETSHWLTWLF